MQTILVLILLGLSLVYLIKKLMGSFKSDQQVCDGCSFHAAAKTHDKKTQQG
jgi:hypothetical protein